VIGRLFFWQYSVAKRPIARTVNSSFDECFLVTISFRRRKILLLYGPAKPLSAVTTILAVFFTSRRSSIGCETSELLLAMFATTSCSFSLKGAYFLAFSSARFILEADTSSIALVICFVLVVEPILSFISFSDAKLFTTSLK